jgi:hypothetical protein
MAFLLVGALFFFTARKVLTHPYPPLGAGGNDPMIVIGLFVAAIVVFIALHVHYFGGAYTTKEDTGLRIGGMTVTRERSGYAPGIEMTAYHRAAYIFGIAMLLFHVLVFLALLKVVPWPMTWAEYLDVEKTLGL